MAGIAVYDFKILTMIPFLPSPHHHSMPNFIKKQNISNPTLLIDMLPRILHPQAAIDSDKAWA
jgi:hypothetical protein